MSTHVSMSTAFARRSLPIDPMRGHRNGITLRIGRPSGTSTREGRSLPGGTRRTFGRRRLRVPSAAFRGRLAPQFFDT